MCSWEDEAIPSRIREKVGALNRLSAPWFEIPIRLAGVIDKFC